MVDDLKAQMSRFLFEVFDQVNSEYGKAMLFTDMNISKLMIHSQEVERDTRRKMYKDTNKTRMDNYEYSQKMPCSRNRSMFQ